MMQCKWMDKLKQSKSHRRGRNSGQIMQIQPKSDELILAGIIPLGLGSTFSKDPDSCLCLLNVFHSVSLVRLKEIIGIIKHLGCSSSSVA